MKIMTPPDTQVPPSATGAMDSATTPELPDPRAAMGGQGRRWSRRPSDFALVGFVVDSTKETSQKLRGDVEATTKMVKDKTVTVTGHVKDATVGASMWVASQTSKTAKAAMEQAKSGLSVGEKFTLFAVEKITAWSRSGFTHFFMFLILAGYTALGALLFIAIESPHETEEKLDIEEARLRLMQGLWDERNSGGNFTDWELLAKDLLKPYDEQLYHSFTIGVSPDTDTKVWTFWKAMFFCSTITTTIALIDKKDGSTSIHGIRHYKSQSATQYRNNNDSFVRICFSQTQNNVTLRATPIYRQNQKLELLSSTPPARHPKRLGKKHRRLKYNLVTNVVPPTPPLDTPTPPLAIPESTSADFDKQLEVELKNRLTSKRVFYEAEEKGTKDKKKKEEEEEEEEKEEDGEEDEPQYCCFSVCMKKVRGWCGLLCLRKEEEEIPENEEDVVDDNFNLPISLALLILLLYIMMGCTIYTIWEEWTYFEAFYFIFISMTTIGFGDYVPEHPAFMMMTTVYLIFGLALTAMCINIIQEKLTDTFRQASEKLKASLSHIMAAASLGEDIGVQEGKEVELAPVHTSTGSDILKRDSISMKKET
ncbi:potassium channel subfamily K member 18-like [Penaeus chinensis]|uniref:potassium channel subfamily K member 18-like n=1 Tax=Penaeus chinensis TaxID=139456 RepID=UPI001FB58D98|nr:potassium channel subfamily K member 18-like [Penaeus chinensis]